MKRSVQVEIAGQLLTIRSDEGPEYVQQLAEFVDGHLQLLSGGKRPSAQSAQRIALLVAMQIADELFREKDLHQRFRRKVHERLLGLRQALQHHEQRLAADEAAPDLPDLPDELSELKQP